MYDLIQSCIIQLYDQHVGAQIGTQRGRRATPEFEAPPSFLGSSVNLSLRRSNNLGLPPAFGSLIEDDEDSWRSSDGFERSPTPADFENIADEDTWATLNGGHLNVDLFNDRSDRRTLSSAASENSKNILVSIVSVFGQILVSSSLLHPTTGRPSRSIGKTH